VVMHGRKEQVTSISGHTQTHHGYDDEVEVSFDPSHSYSLKGFARVTVKVKVKVLVLEPSTDNSPSRAASLKYALLVNCCLTAKARSGLAVGEMLCRLTARQIRLICEISLAPGATTPPAGGAFGLSGTRPPEARERWF